VDLRVIEKGRTLLHELLLSLSEVEARLSIPNDPIRLRRLLLQLRDIKFGNHLWIGRGLRINNMGNLILGERCAIGAFSKIANHALITIGDDFLSAPGLTLDSGSHEPVSMKPIMKPIKIGNRVWCGVNVVLGAGSVVCEDIPSNSIAVGVPAKVINALHRDASIWSIFYKS
jgi:maltose O-acetyltransferase